MWYQVKSRPIVFRLRVADLPADASFVNASQGPSFLAVDGFRLVLAVGEELTPALEGKREIGLGSGVKLLTGDDHRRKGELF